jgi:S1-C subfamily serine protease
MNLFRQQGSFSARPGSKLALGIGIVFIAGLTVGVLLTSPWSKAAPGDDLTVVEPAAGSVVPTGGRTIGVSDSGDGLPGSEAARRAGVLQGSPRMTPVVAAAERVSPSVVSVMVTRRVQRRPSPFDEFLGRARSQTVQGIGSGFAIDDAGYILTNHHVVRGADSIVVMNSSGRLFQADLIGTDELSDLALLKVVAGSVPPAPLGTSDDLIVGEPAVAIGNPSGFFLVNTESTVTSGVISGVGRDILSEEGREVLYADMVQTDAAINQGNSGGPLVNALGEVIGVNTVIFSRSGGSEGLGFAIPMDRALRVAAELRDFGRIRLAWVGVDVINMESDSLKRLPVVDRVAPDSPGSRAGMRAGDVLVSLDGEPIQNPMDWEVGLLEAGIAQTVQVRYRRDGSERTVRMQVEELPSERAERVEVLRGLELVSVTPQIAQERGLEAEAGALIVAIDENTTRITGLRRGDVIVGINRQRVQDANQAGEMFNYLASGDGWVRVWVDRNGSTLTSTFQIRS